VKFKVVKKISIILTGSLIKLYCQFFALSKSFVFVKSVFKFDNQTLQPIHLCKSMLW